MLRVVNLLMLAVLIYSAFCLVNQRYQSRIDHARLAALKNQADMFNREYTKLELEEGTFSSNLVLQDFAVNKLGLIQPDKNHIIGMK
ncbi:MAG: cell division protein FtsL [Burkholderiales bacterium]|nr:cell division protein FtsL [Burkholderiales bacterium]